MTHPKYAITISDHQSITWLADIVADTLHLQEAVQLRYCDITLRRQMERAIRTSGANPKNPLIDWHRTGPR